MSWEVRCADRGSLERHSSSTSQHPRGKQKICTSGAYNLGQTDSRLVHKALSNLGHDHIQREHDSNDDGNNGVGNAEHPELLSAVELGTLGLLHVLVFFELVIVMTVLIFFTDIEGHGVALFLCRSFEWGLNGITMDVSDEGVEWNVSRVRGVCEGVVV